MTKKAEILERETRYWMEKSLQDLSLLENNIFVATKKSFDDKKSKNRFSVINDGWSFSTTEYITFATLK